MKLMIVGMRSIGEWTEAVERAALALGHETRVFYYNTFGDLRWRGAVARFAPPRFYPQIWPVTSSIGGAWESYMNRQLVAAARRFDPHAILVLKGESIYPDTVEALRRRGRPVVAWWVDDPLRFPRHVPTLRKYDQFFIFDKGRTAELASHGIQHIGYLPCACDASTFRPMNLNNAEFPGLQCRVGLVATFYPGRGELLARLRDLEVGLWGTGWEEAPELKLLPRGTWRGKRIRPVDAARVYNLAAICPNVHHPQTRIGGINTRTFEIPAAGGFELVDQVPGLDEHFELGRELVAFSSPEHFRELADYYLAHPVERRAIAERGRARVLREHTYEHRLQTLLAEISA
jgi:spore maturation protein CgeB